MCHAFYLPSQTTNDEADDTESSNDENGDETEEATSETLKPGTDDQKQKVLVKPKKRIRHYDDDDFFSHDDEYNFYDDWEDYSRYDDWEDDWEDFAKERE